MESTHKPSDQNPCPPPHFNCHDKVQNQSNSEQLIPYKKLTHKWNTEARVHTSKQRKICRGTSSSITSIGKSRLDSNFDLGAVIDYDFDYDFTRNDNRLML